MSDRGLFKSPASPEINFHLSYGLFIFLMWLSIIRYPLPFRFSNRITVVISMSKLGGNLEGLTYSVLSKR